MADKAEPTAIQPSATQAKFVGSSNDAPELTDMDGDDPPSVLYAKIVTAARSAEPYSVQVRDDTGTPVNWIHPDIVDKCKLNREQCDPFPVRDFQNGKFECTERVHVHWAGKDNRTRDGIFFVAPKQSDVVLVLGDKYVRANGRAEEVCVAKTIRGARPFVLDPLSKQEEEKKKQREKESKQDVAVLQKRRESASNSHRSGTPSHRDRKGDRKSRTKA